MRLEIVVQGCATCEQKMDIERIPGFHVTTGKKRFTFLEQQVACAWCKDNLVGSTGDGFLNDLGFQDISANSGEIDAEEGLLIRDDPLLDEVRAVDVLAEFQLAKAESLCDRLNARTNGRLDFFGFWDL